jgi:hypothetical protein
MKEKKTEVENREEVRWLNGSATDFKSAVPGLNQALLPPRQAVNF